MENEDKQLRANENINHYIKSINDYLMWENVASIASQSNSSNSSRRDILLHNLEKLSENIPEMSDTNAIKVLNIASSVDTKIENMRKVTDDIILKTIKHHPTERSVQWLAQFAGFNLNIEAIKSNPQIAPAFLNELCQKKWKRAAQIGMPDRYIIESIISVQPDLASTALEYITNEEHRRTEPGLDCGTLASMDDDIKFELKKMPREKLPAEWQEYFDNQEKQRAEQEAKEAERRRQQQLEYEKNEEKRSAEREAEKAKETERLKRETEKRLQEGKIEDQIIEQLNVGYVDYIKGNTSKPFYPSIENVRKAVSLMDNLTKINRFMFQDILDKTLDLKSFSNVDENIISTLARNAEKIENNQDIIQTIFDVQQRIQRNSQKKKNINADSILVAQEIKERKAKNCK